MTPEWFGGVAVGVGVGYLNATFLGIPGWANIAMMFALAAIYGVGMAAKEGK